MARDSRHERIVRCLERLLKGLRAGTGDDGYWYTPDRVLVLGGYADKRIEEFLDEHFPVQYLILPGPEPEGEEGSGRRAFEATIDIACCRKDNLPDEAADAPGNIVASGTWANGAITIANQPREAALLQATLEDPSGLMSAGAMTINGLDQDGAALSIVWTPLTDPDGLDARLRADDWRLFASVSGATIAGTVGADNRTTFSLRSRLDRSTIQSRLLKDVERLIAENPQLAPCASGIENIGVTLLDRNVYAAGWAIAFATLVVKYSLSDGC